MSKKLDLNLDDVDELPNAGHPFDTECAWCGAVRMHRVLRAWDTDFDPDDTFESRPVLREGTRFVLAECTRCEAPLLLGWQPLVDDLWDVEPDSMEWQQLWPVPKQPMSAPNGCPQSATNFLNQAVECQTASPVAAVMLTRKAVEVICASLGFHGGLAADLRKMRDQGVIDQRLWAWSDLLRKVGNRGAHDHEDSVTAEDAGDGIWFTSELIHQVFVVQPRFVAFAHRHLRREPQPNLRLVDEHPEAASILD